MLSKYKQPGFTVVELLVVIIVIGILASISLFSYQNVQQEARDTKRQSDMVLIQNELEKYFDKHGEYPPGCPRSSCTSWFFTDNTSSPILNSTSTVANIISALPGVRQEFGDPVIPVGTPPLMDTNTSVKEYYYFGGAVNNTAGTTSSLSYGATASFPCAINIPLSPGEVSSYVIGYFSEAGGKWVLNGGKKGKQLTITAGTVAQGCVINPA